MDNRRLKGSRITIREFNADRIEIRSTRGASPYVIIPAVTGSFLTVTGAVQGLVQGVFLPLPAGFILGIGMFLVFVAFLIRGSPWNITVNGTSRAITGLPDFPGTILFKDVVGINLEPIEGSSQWSLEIELNRIGVFNFIREIPLDLALCLGSHISFILARPLRTPNTVKAPGIESINWILPFKLPEGRFLSEWFLASAGIASVAIILTYFGFANLFHPAVVPRWLMVLVLTIPAAHAAVSLQNRYDIRVTGNFLAVIMMMIIALTVAALRWPSIVSMALISGVFFSLIALDSWLRKRRILLIVIISIVFLIIGSAVGISALIGYYNLKNIDANVVNEIVVKRDSSSDESWNIVKPEEISEIVKAFKFSAESAAFLRTTRKPVSTGITVIMVRPFGTDVILDVRKEGSGTDAVAVAELWGSFLGVPMKICSFISPSADIILTHYGRREGFWPPEMNK
ncbi:hypothetical protein JW979_10400 [bacterium]|nr:hypothetical protein [candidate division CSSED10-310 bacterium]